MSGDDTIWLDDPLASVMYDLITQHIPPGVLDEIIDRVAIMEEGKEVKVEYHLGHVAMQLAEKLRELKITPLKVQLPVQQTGVYCPASHDHKCHRTDCMGSICKQKEGMS